MSRPWNSRVRIGVGPHGVRVALEPGRFSRRTAAAAERPLETNGRERASALTEALVAALAELALDDAPKGIAAFAEIDDEWALFDVVAGDFRANPPGALGRIAQACADELLGADAPSWLVRWQLQPSERHLFIAMLPADVCAAIEESAIGHRLSLRGLEPRFCRTWNRCAGDVAGDCVFVAASARQAVVACVERRAISALGTGPWSALDSGKPGATRTTLALASLDALVDRLATSHGIDPAAVPEYRLAVADASTWTSPGRWTVVEAGGMA